LYKRTAAQLHFRPELTYGEISTGLYGTVIF
jgi:hypothetical protein